MRKLVSITGAVCLAFFLGACDEAPTTPEAMSTSQAEGPLASKKGAPTVGSSAKSLGKVTLDTDVSSWDIGTGNPNGEFITAEVQGVVIGLRALERFVGLLGVTGDNGDRVAVYEAPAGPSPRSAGDNNGTWNYDFHVDLANASGRHAGKSLSDYRLVLEQDFTGQSLFGTLGSDPVELPMVAGVCDPGSFDPDTLCQQSWNPGFGNSDYDPDAERTYTLRLVLTPETFNANPLAVVMRVVVTSD